MVSAQINYWAVLVTALVGMVIGAIWYSPKAFGSQWQALVGRPSTKVSSTAMGMMYLKMLLATLIMTFVLAHFIDYVGATTIAEGLVTGVWVWLGFVATTMFMNILAENKPLRLWSINSGYQLVLLAIAGAVIAVWA